MKSRVPGPAWQCGFTLIELMLVLVILGVMYSMVAINLGGAQQVRLERETARLLSVVQALRREAIVQRSPTGLAVDPKGGYQGLLFNTLSQRWEADQRRLLREHDLAAGGLALQLIDGDNSAVSNPRTADWPAESDGEGERRPAIVFDSSGFSGPYSLRLAWLNTPQGARTLVADGTGEVVVE